MRETNRLFLGGAGLDRADEEFFQGSLGGIEAIKDREAENLDFPREIKHSRRGPGGRSTILISHRQGQTGDLYEKPICLVRAESRRQSL